jgi:hypothetical protein
VSQAKIATALVFIVPVIETTGAVLFQTVKKEVWSIGLDLKDWVWDLGRMVLMPILENTIMCTADFVRCPPTLFCQGALVTHWLCA